MEPDKLADELADNLTDNLTGKLAGKVAVITGSTRGLGLGIARLYLQAGAKVVISSRSTEAVAAALKQLDSPHAVGLAGDVSRYEDVLALKEKALASFGRLDVWVNNAGQASVYGPTAELAPDAFRQVIESNILGVYLGSSVALRHFGQQNAGKLINLLGRGDKQPVANQNAYGSSKSWVRTFTRALVKENKGKNIGIYMLNPGLVDTDMLRQVRVVAGHEKDLAFFATIIRLFARAPEKAAVKAVYLASNATDGKSGLEVQALSRAQMLLGVSAEGLRRLRRKRAANPSIQLTAVAPFTDAEPR